MKDKIYNTLNSQEVWRKLVLILRPEKSFYSTTIVYSIGVSILSLAVPISVQALVNTVTFGVLLQPLIILSVVLLSLLVFSSTLNALQAYIIEMFERHFYARTTVDISLRLLNGNYKELEKKNSTKLVDKYFDVMTVQKSVSSLLAGGIDIILQTFAGLLLLAFYHPYFLAFDLILLILLYLTWTFFWKKSAQTAVLESKAKYETASWLEEMARMNLFFKTKNRKQYAIQRSDDNILSYIKKRENHFRVTFIQYITLLAIYALMSAFVLALGGFLVIEGELTLGQLVAAELIVTVILSNFSKAGKYLKSFYDLYAAVDKISIFYSIDFEKDKGSHDSNILDNQNYNLNFKQVEVMSDRFDHQVRYNYNFEQGKTYLINTRYYSSKLILLELLEKLISPDKGMINIGEHKFSELSASLVRDFVYVLDKPVVIEGTLEENLRVGNKDIISSEINTALEIVELDHLYTTFTNGLSQKIISSGYPLWSSQIIRLEIARIILLKPKIVVLTESFDQIESSRRKKIMNYFHSKEITVLMFSHRDNENFKIDKYLSLRDDEFIEFSSRESLERFLKE